MEKKTDQTIVSPILQSKDVNQADSDIRIMKQVLTNRLTRLHENEQLTQIGQNLENYVYISVQYTCCSYSLVTFEKLHPTDIYSCCSLKVKEINYAYKIAHSPSRNKSNLIESAICREYISLL